MMLLKERGRIRQDLVELDENDTFEDDIENLEKKFFRKQIEIYDLDLKILEEEEKLARMYLKDFMNDEQEEEDIFYVAFEEQPEDEDLNAENPSSKEDSREDPEDLKRKKEWASGLNRIFRKRAWIRNRKVCLWQICFAKELFRLILVNIDS